MEKSNLFGHRCKMSSFYFNERKILVFTIFYKKMLSANLFLEIFFSERISIKWDRGGGHILNGHHAVDSVDSTYLFYDSSKFDLLGYTELHGRHDQVLHGAGLQDGGGQR